MFQLSVTWEGLEKGDQVLRTKDHESDLVTGKDTGQPCGPVVERAHFWVHTWHVNTQTDEAIATVPELGT